MVCHSQLKKRETENKRKEHDEEMARLCLQGRGALREDITRYLSWEGVQRDIERVFVPCHGDAGKSV